MFDHKSNIIKKLADRRKRYILQCGSSIVKEELTSHNKLPIGIGRSKGCTGRVHRNTGSTTSNNKKELIGRKAAVKLGLTTYVPERSTEEPKS